MYSPCYYGRRILKRIWNIRHAERGAMLRPKIKMALCERRTPLCIEFTKCRPTIQKILTNRWRMMHNDFRLLTLFPYSPTPAFTSRPKLKSILSKKRSKFNVPPSDRNLTPDKAQEFEFLKFNHPRPIAPPPPRNYLPRNPPSLPHRRIP